MSLDGPSPDRSPSIGLVLLLGLLLVAVPLAGCVGSSGGGAGDGAPADDGDGGGDEGAGPDGTPGDGGDGTGGGAGPDGAGNVSAEATAWVEDYWGGAEEVTLVDDSGTFMNGFTSTGPVTSCIFFCQGAFFRPDEEALVAPGTARVNVTATWQAPPTAPGGMQVTLTYQTAAGGDAEQVELQSGETTTLEVGPGDRDAPLQPASHWWFFLTTLADPAGTMVQGVQVDFTAVAERGPDLPAVAEAPDPWAEGETIPLVQGAQRQVGLTVETPMGTLCMFFPCQPLWESENGSLVPADTERVEATLSWDWAGPSRPVLTVLHPAGADAMELVEDGESSRTFELEVTAEMADSPWQDRSLWIFEVNFDPSPDRSGPVTGTVTLDAQSVRGGSG